MSDTKIYIITYFDNNIEYVDYGIGNETLKIYTLPPEKLSNMTFQRDEVGRYV